MPMRRPPEDGKPDEDLEIRKRRIEVEQLETELDTKRRQAKRPWWLPHVLSTLGAVGVTVMGVLFGDSLMERSRAEIRKDVLMEYFAVDNQQAGKRDQVLRFVQAFLADDDPKLAEWVREERKVVEKALAELEEERKALDKSIEEADAELARLKQQAALGAAVGEGDAAAARTKRSITATQQLMDEAANTRLTLAAHEAKRRSLNARRARVVRKISKSSDKKKPGDPLGDF